MSTRRRSNNTISIYHNLLANYFSPPRLPTHVANLEAAAKPAPPTGEWKVRTDSKWKWKLNSANMAAIKVINLKPTAAQTQLTHRQLLPPPLYLCVRVCGLPTLLVVAWMTLNMRVCVCVACVRAQFV